MRTRIVLTLALAVPLAGGIMACRDLVGAGPLPAGTQDPASLNNPTGALQMYQAAIVAFNYGSIPEPTVNTRSQGAYVRMLRDGGVLTDELQYDNLGGSPLYYGSVLSPNTDEYSVVSADARQAPELFTGNANNLEQRNAGDYTAFNEVRSAARQGIGALAKYAEPKTSTALRGHLYALLGYSELYLADLFCSGVPLSTLDFEGGYTYQAGSTTADVYQHAKALFDTAVTLSADSARILNLARVGQARALVALGRYSDAKAAVAGVPNDFQYTISIAWGDGLTAGVFQYLSVADREGENGFPFRSAGDPRTAVLQKGTNQAGLPQFVPAKYGTGTAPAVVASAIEARLIEAEASLPQNGAAGVAGTAWLDQLNALRTDGTFSTTQDPGDPSVIDTAWNAGVGGVPGLRPLSDPGSDTARVTMLFNERAAWLFATGIRQGDLRRLVRNYHRDQARVYPTNGYGAVYQRYGSDVDLPIPQSERANPLFRGCLNRGA